MDTTTSDDPPVGSLSSASLLMNGADIVNNESEQQCDDADVDDESPSSHSPKSLSDELANVDI